MAQEASGLHPRVRNGSVRNATLRRPPSRWLDLTLVIVAVAVITVILLWYAYAPGGPLNPILHPRVAVTDVDWTGYELAFVSSPGFNVEAGAPVWVSVSLYCANGTNILGQPVAESCDSGSVLIATVGFELISTNAPVTWSSGLSGATATVTVHVLTPTQAYSGDLTIELH